MIRLNKQAQVVCWSFSCIIDVLLPTVFTASLLFCMFYLHLVSTFLSRISSHLCTHIYHHTQSFRYITLWEVNATLSLRRTHTHSGHSAAVLFCRILLWVLCPRWVRWLVAPEELVGRDSWAKLLKYGKEFPLSPPPRQLAPLCAIMEIKCTEGWNEGGRWGGWGGEGEVWEKRSKNVRFMELGKLKVIKSEDYSTAKLSKFLREVEGFSLVLNREALGGCNIHHSPFIFSPFIPFCSPFFSPPTVRSFFQPRSRQTPKFVFRAAFQPLCCSAKSNKVNVQTWSQTETFPQHLGSFWRMKLLQHQ